MDVQRICKNVCFPDNLRVHRLVDHTHTKCIADDSISLLQHFLYFCYVDGDTGFESTAQSYNLTRGSRGDETRITEK